MTDNKTPNFTNNEINQFLKHNYNLSGELKKLPSYCDQNLWLTTNDNQQYVVKIAHSEEPLIELEMQNAAMVHLSNKKMLVPHAIPNQNNELISKITNTNQHSFVFRVLTFLPGNIYADSKNHNSDLWSHLGQFTAEIDIALEDFKHVGAYRYLEWDLAQSYRICQTKKHLLTQQQLTTVDYFIDLYKAQTLPFLSDLPQSIIHNDINDYNLLIDELEQPKRIVGLIDFGDMVYSHTINELAICCAYTLMNQKNPLLVLKTLVASYYQIKKLTDREIEVLFSLIAMRLCTSVCNSALALKQQPDNQYLLVSIKPAWQLLAQLKSSNPYSVTCQLREACGLSNSAGLADQAIVDYRQKHLSKNLSLSYQNPIKIVQGQGAYLYDENGKPYLDMINNVCHVGHCHPKVVAAGQEQMAKLNTNTRFLHDNIINYSQKLLATMPEPLSVCMFVNSGSEANELALRLAKTYTKSKELIVVDGAYHGNTNACIEASPYKFDGAGGEGAQPYVHKVLLPDPYRGKFQGNTKTTAKAYADSVKRALSCIEEQGKKVGAFLCESLQGVAGQIIMPDGYLSAAYQHVRDAGGVCIADEIQVGFGRVGTHMWAFETQNVVPDIVTLGKPIGNGHPLAAVITTQAIADAFVTGMEYFNTFGGNPVSCAIGMAVLDVIEQENLQQNAFKTGQYFQQQLKNLQHKFNLIGDVRGLGLFIGVEFVEDRTSKEPATKKTAWLIEYLKQQNILLSSEGPFYNILKIKPPIVFNQNDVDQFIKALENGLGLLD